MGLMSFLRFERIYCLSTVPVGVLSVKDRAVLILISSMFFTKIVASLTLMQCLTGS